MTRRGAKPPSESSPRDSIAPAKPGSRSEVVISSLPVVQPGPGEPRLEGGARHEGDERARRFGHGAARGEAGSVGRDLLEVFRQRAQQGDALAGLDLAVLVGDELYLAPVLVLYRVS